MHCTTQKLIVASLITVACLSSIADPLDSTKLRNWTVRGNDNIHATLVDLESVEIDGKKTVVVKLKSLEKSKDSDKNLLEGDIFKILKIPLQDLSPDEQKQALQEYAVILNAQRYSAKPRNWTKKNGEKVHASFIALKATQIDQRIFEFVVLERSSDAKMFNVPLEKLSAADQKNASRQAKRKQSLGKLFVQKQKEARQIQEIYAAERLRKLEERDRLKKQHELALLERGEPDVRGVFWDDPPEIVAFAQQEKGLVVEKREVTVKDQRIFLKGLHTKSRFTKEYSAEIIQEIQRQNHLDLERNHSKKENLLRDDPGRSMSADQIWQRVPRFVGENLKTDITSTLNRYISGQLARRHQKAADRKGIENDKEPLIGRDKSRFGNGKSKTNRKNQDKEIAKLRSKIDQYVSKEFGLLLDELRLERHVRLHGDISLLDERQSITFFFSIGKLSRVKIQPRHPARFGTPFFSFPTRSRHVLIEKYGECLTKNGHEINQLEQTFLGGDPERPNYDPNSFFSEWRLPRTTIELRKQPDDYSLTYNPVGSSTFLSDFYARIDDANKTQLHKDKTQLGKDRTQRNKDKTQLEDEL